MRPITPIPSPLPTYAFACSSLNDLRLIDGEYANHFPVFVPMLYPIAKLLSKVYCASKWLSYKNLTGSVCGLPWHTFDIEWFFSPSFHDEETL